MTEIEQVLARLKGLESKVQVAIANDLSWGQKHWGFIVAGALILGFVIGKI